MPAPPTPSLLSSTVLAVAATAVAAAQWPQWRRPDRSAHAELEAPQSWPAELTRVWRVEVGAGLSSPVIAGGRAYLLTRDGHSVADSPTWTYPAVAGDALLVKDERHPTLWRLD